MFLYRLVALLFIMFGTTHSVAKDTSYWVWAGIEPTAEMNGHVLYIYQGHVSDQRSYERLGVSPHPIDNEVYLVFRVSSCLPDTKFINDIFIETAKHWQRHGVNIIGMQLDFDSPTSKLLTYSKFLSYLRAQLSPEYKLSITGLSDWIVFGDRDVLNNMSDICDEIVFQLYQDRAHFDNIHTYLRKLPKLKIPYKIGLLAHGNPESYSKLVDHDDHFKGSVLFVQNLGD